MDIVTTAVLQGMLDAARIDTAQWGASPGSKRIEELAAEINSGQSVLAIGSGQVTRHVVRIHLNVYFSARAGDGGTETPIGSVQFLARQNGYTRGTYPAQYLRRRNLQVPNFIAENVTQFVYGECGFVIDPLRVELLVDTEGEDDALSFPGLHTKFRLCFAAVCLEPKEIKSLPELRYRYGDPAFRVTEALPWSR